MSAKKVTKKKLRTTITLVIVILMLLCSVCSSLLLGAASTGGAVFGVQVMNSDTARQIVSFLTENGLVDQKMLTVFANLFAAAETAPPVSGGEVEIHFIDVGQG